MNVNIFVSVLLKSSQQQSSPWVLKNKIDDLTPMSSSLANNLNLSLRSGSDLTPTGGSMASIYVSNVGWGDGAAPMDDATTDLDAMVKSILTNSKYNIPATLCNLWGGWPGWHCHELEMRQQHHRAGSHDWAMDDDDDGGIAVAIWWGTGGKVHKKGQAFAHGITEWTGWAAREVWDTGHIFLTWSLIYRLDIGRLKKNTGDAMQAESDMSAGHAQAQSAHLPSLFINRCI